MLRSSLLGSIFGCSLLAACSNASTGVASCGLPAPTAAPNVALVFPIPGATGVPIGIGAIVYTGGNEITPASLDISSMSGRVAIGTVMTAPSPLPAPNAIPTGYFSSSFEEATIPELASETTYTVSYSYVIDRSGPPSCDLHYSTPLGSFTTQ